MFRTFITAVIAALLLSAPIRAIQNNTVYKIVNVMGGTVLDLSATDQHSIIGWGDHNGDNQHWMLEQSGTQWTFKNVMFGLYLSPNNSAIQDANPLQGLAQPVTWDLTPKLLDATVFRISLHSNPSFVVDLTSGSNVWGTIVQLHKFWGGKMQFWKFVPV